MSKHTLLWARIRKAGSTIRRLRAELGEARASQIRQANWLRRLGKERDAACRDAKRFAEASMFWQRRFEDMRSERNAARAGLRRQAIRFIAAQNNWCSGRMGLANYLGDACMYDYFRVRAKKYNQHLAKLRARHPREKREEAGHGH